MHVCHFKKGGGGNKGTSSMHWVYGTCPIIVYTNRHSMEMWFSIMQTALTNLNIWYPLQAGSAWKLS